MSPPKGMRYKSFQAPAGGSVHLYSGPGRIIMQLRREVPTVEDVLSPSVKVAVEFTGWEAILIAAELLQAASTVYPGDPLSR